MKRQATGIASPNPKAYAQSVRVFGMGGIKNYQFLSYPKNAINFMQNRKDFYQKRMILKMYMKSGFLPQITPQIKSFKKACY